MLKTNLLDVRNIDCMDLMKEFPDNHFDLAIVDPPYGIDAANMTMGTSDSRGDYISSAQKLKRARFSKGCGKLKDRSLNKMGLDWDSSPPPPEYFEELFRVSKNQIIWGGNYFNLPPSRGVICWDKKQAWTNFSQWEMAWTSFNKPAALFAMSNSGSHLGKKIHPTQKPVKLYAWLLQKYATADMKILDTHMGSGSIAIACHNLGIHLTTSELDEDYYTAACDRIKKETKSHLF